MYQDPFDSAPFTFRESSSSTDLAYSRSTEKAYGAAEEELKQNSDQIQIQGKKVTELEAQLAEEGRRLHKEKAKRMSLERQLKEAIEETASLRVKLDMANLAHAQMLSRSVPKKVQSVAESKNPKEVNLDVLRVKKKLDDYKKNKMSGSQEWPTLCQLVLQQSLKKTDEFYISKEESNRYIASISKQPVAYAAMVSASMPNVTLGKRDSFHGLDARFLAVSYNNLSLLKQLLEPLSKQDKFKRLKRGTYAGATLLHLACQEGRVDIACWLMSKDQSMSSPIHRAGPYNNWTPVMLLMLPAHSDSLKARRLTIFNHALSEAHLLINEKLGGLREAQVKWFKGMKEEQTLTDWSLLELAAYMGMQGFAKALLQCGATYTKDIHTKITMFESNPDVNVQKHLFKNQREVIQVQLRAHLEMYIDNRRVKIKTAKRQCLEGEGTDSERSTSSLDALVEAAETSPRVAEKKLCVRSEEELDGMNALLLSASSSSHSSASSSSSHSSASSSSSHSSASSSSSLHPHSLFSMERALFHLGTPSSSSQVGSEFYSESVKEKSVPGKRG